MVKASVKEPPARKAAAAARPRVEEEDDDPMISNVLLGVVRRRCTDWLFGAASYSTEVPYLACQGRKARRNKVPARWRWGCGTPYFAEKYISTSSR